MEHTLTVLKVLNLICVKNISAFVLSVAKQVLPELSKLLENKDWRDSTPDKAKATACLMLHRLLLVDQEISKKTINKELVIALTNIIEEW